MAKFFRAMLMVWMIVVLAGCAGAAQPAEGGTAVETVAVEGGVYRNIDVPTLQRMLASKDFTLVNVHIPFEGDLPDTDLSIPYNEIEPNLGQLPADKNAKIVLYCRSGRMSEIAAETLIGLGYSNVWNLDGGMVAWERDGLPIEGK